MQLTLLRERSKKVSPREMTSYRAFRDGLGGRRELETHALAKFYATRLLIEEGCVDVFIDAPLILQHQEVVVKKIVADVCGERNGQLTVVFCETRAPTPELYETLRLMSLVTNTEAIIVCPYTTDVNELTTRFVDHFDSGKFSVASITWFRDELESAFKEVMKLVTLLGNDTRMKMLLPLLTQSRKKRHYRRRINPKLIYENLPTLIEHRLINEQTNDEYTLTPIGREVLSEYLTFLQNIKRIIETTDEEVKNNGLG